MRMSVPFPRLRRPTQIGPLSWTATLIPHFAMLIRMVEGAVPHQRLALWEGATMGREHSAFFAVVAEHARLMASLAEQRARRLSYRVFSVEGGQLQHLRAVMASRAAIGRSKELLVKQVYKSRVSTVEISPSRRIPPVAAQHLRSQTKWH